MCSSRWNVRLSYYPFVGLIKRCLAFIALGGVINILAVVACCLVYGPSCRGESRVVLIRRPDGAVWESVVVEQAGATVHNFASCLPPEAVQGLPDPLPAGLTWSTLRFSWVPNQQAGSCEGRGWPCIAGWYLVKPRFCGFEPTKYDGVDLRGLPGLNRCVLPTHPAWGGILWNTAFYAVMAGIASAGWAGARRWWRQPTRCVNCGYDRRATRSDTPCPECGLGCATPSQS
jgi:hypothetical protein